jgi:hypothetical protein
MKGPGNHSRVVHLNLIGNIGFRQQAVIKPMGTTKHIIQTGRRIPSTPPRLLSIRPGRHSTQIQLHFPSEQSVSLQTERRARLLLTLNSMLLSSKEAKP